jgi:hypothetical protein
MKRESDLVKPIHMGAMDVLTGPDGKGYPRGKKTAVWGVARLQGV